MALLVALAMLLSMPGFALASEITEPTEAPVRSVDTSEAVGELYKMDDRLVDAAGLVYGEPPETARKLRAAARVSVPTYQEAYDGMIALKAKYPEGMPWTNFTPYGRDGTLGDTYWWRGGPVKGARGGVGCAAFVFLLSDAVFEDLPARTMDNGTFTYDDVKVGDILRVDNSHFVIVIQKSAGGVTVAEGNFNKSVHWGRAMSKAEVMASNFIVTRYPVNFVPSDAEDADEVAESGTEGSLGWTLTKGGILTITGSGAMPNFTADNLPSWSAHNDKVSSIVIEQGITSVGDFAFCQSKALAVYIPDGVTSIGESAFYESDLLAVTVPSSVISIGDKAFYMCPNLTSVTMSEGLEMIGEQAFRGCTALTHADFPASVTSLGAGAFVSCSAMKQVRFKPGTETVRIGDNLFSQCWYLSSVTLPLKLDRIGKGMFESCTALTKIYIPANVSEIGESAFTQCAYLQADGIYFGGSQQDWANIGGNAALVTLQPLKVNVYYDVDFDDPFAKDPDDPGDLVISPTDPPEVDYPCKDGHVGTATDDGTCSVCGKPMTTPTASPEATPTPTAEPTPEVTATPEPEESPTPAPEETPSPSPDATASPNPTATPSPEPPAHQHSWATSWHFGGGFHWHDCTAPNCPIKSNSEKDGFGACTFRGWVVDKEATAYLNGIKHRDCVTCGWRQTVSIPATGGSTTRPNPTPKPSNTPQPTANPTPPTETPIPTYPPLPEPTPGTVTNPDGSTTTTIIDEETGEKIEVTKRPDWSTTVVTTQKNGLVVTVDVNPALEVHTSVQLPAEMVEEALQNDQAIPLPIDATPVEPNPLDVPSITVHTGADEDVRVEIPAVGPTATAVLVVVNADGSMEVIKTAVATDDSLVASLPDGITVKVIDNKKEFADIAEKAWYAQAVDFAAARELFAGTSSTTFAPESAMTRAMLMTVLARLEGVDTKGGETWYSQAVEWAMAAGISDGTSPNGKITREQLVTMLWRYAGSPASAGATLNFSDAGQISNYAQAAMQWAVENGIMSGYGNGRLGPKGFATRAQVAQMLSNFIKKMTLGSAK